MNDPTGVSFLISILMVFVVMYFLILRPQAKRQKEREAMMKKVGKGDRVLTTGGFYGTVVSVKGDDVLLVKFGDNRPFEVTRQAVASNLGPSGEVEGSS
jgi:preprotein translocase subunit YajC